MNENWIISADLATVQPKLFSRTLGRKIYLVQFRINVGLPWFLKQFREPLRIRRFLERVVVIFCKITK